MRHFMVYMKKYFALFILGIVLVSFEAICDLMQPTILANIIDIGIANKDMNYLINKGFLMVVITIAGAVFAILRSIISTNVSQKFARDLRSDVFKHINSYSFENIDKITKGSLITRSTNDINQIQQFVNGLMRIIIKAPILCIGSFILAMKLNLKLSIVLLVGIIIIFGIIIINLNIGTPYFKKVQISLDNLNSNLRQYLCNIRIVKLFNRVKYEEEKFENVNMDLLEVTEKAMKISAVFKPTITLISNIIIAAILYLGSKLILKNEIEVGVIVAYINYIGRILTSLLMIAHIFNVFIRAKASSERVIEVLDTQNDIDKRGNIKIDISGSLEFKNVNFSYTDNEKVLNDISFKINQGEHIGIIGPTGSGKTTLISLIMKFYKIDKGILNIDGNDINDLDSKNLREYIGLVPQKSTLFNKTIINNIKMGNRKASLDEVIEVCKICECDEFIKNFESGYEQMVGENGANLSGGQKQRVCIARALIKNPKILILDDSFSAMDIKTENRIKNNIKNYLDNTTYIVVSQKISSILDMDKIIVLENGKIVGFDNHSSLLKQCDMYKEIYNSQISPDV
ncbi:ABC transporter ATP-binding protein/permease [Paraclostridium bifermentans]|uniref:ABC transporter ATP-binding protein n=1 Tax=Paraclostridium bifermentans TaxID=1490 RepID=UPI00038D1141|nr:ABC transporter ATP-binding protein [Paraclostridium bifermentans]EQK38039.1 ABC transporter family protein [[Clostridium] bifermentans ATCC 19299] [Paraclostridium bifermentans ATCC 19299]MCE9675200.1 ABC transporter ATP-binding protein/permease [Paraclostridium bifermentans]MDV8114459.1 ABC transporter ATP-binding protein [Bacillus sp. BAU-SS-2023]